MLLTVRNGEMIGNWFQAEVLFCLHIILKFFSLYPFQWEMVKMGTTSDTENSFHTHRDTHVHIHMHTHTLTDYCNKSADFPHAKKKITKRICKCGLL